MRGSCDKLTTTGPWFAWQTLICLLVCFGDFNVEWPHASDLVTRLLISQTLEKTLTDCRYFSYVVRGMTVPIVMLWVIEEFPQNLQWIHNMQNFSPTLLIRGPELCCTESYLRMKNNIFNSILFGVPPRASQLWGRSHYGIPDNWTPQAQVFSWA